MVQTVFNDRRKTGRLDLEAVETALLSAMHQAGAAALSKLLEFEAPPDNQRTLPCSCGQQARYLEVRTKIILSVVGPTKLSRPYYLCLHCHHGQFPADVALDVEKKELSPGVCRMISLVGQQGPFDHGRQLLKLLANLDITTKAVERTAEAIGEDIAAGEQGQIQQATQLNLPMVIGESIPILYVQMDGTGVPVVKQETADRKGKTDGQPAHTREVKLGCVFTQGGWDKEGYAIRDEDSTTYTGAIETAEEFGKRIYREAWDRGWNRAEKKVIIGDGAVWIWNLAGQQFPGAMQIVDLYHAREHLSELAKKLYPNDPAAQKAWLNIHQNTLLDEGKIEELVASLRRTSCTNADLLEALATEARYFETNAGRMRYPAFRAQHLFVGSGVIEAGCKTVIGSRLKRSGMFWTVRGANAIIALRCCYLNGRFEDYWEDRRAA